MSDTLITEEDMDTLFSSMRAWTEDAAKRSTLLTDLNHPWRHTVLPALEASLDSGMWEVADELFEETPSDPNEVWTDSWGTVS